MVEYSKPEKSGRFMWRTRSNVFFVPGSPVFTGLEMTVSSMYSPEQSDASPESSSAWTCAERSRPLFVAGNSTYRGSS
jgi:hypothetical protein